MIDLHSHILPSTDDGARDLEISIAMARLAVADGVKIMAATPHFEEGLYPFAAEDIKGRISALQAEFDRSFIPLRLVSGGDNRLEPNLVNKLEAGRALTLNDTRFVLVEPPHDVFPSPLEAGFSDLMKAGYLPILTHPERMAWFPHRFGALERLVSSGVHMQVTAGSLLGDFGRGALLASQKLFERGMVSIVASDAHDDRARPPGLSRADEWVRSHYGDRVSDRIFFENPEMILRNQPFEPGIPVHSEDWVKPAPLQNIMSKLRSFVLRRAS